MSKMNFPNNPQVGDIFVVDNLVRKWNGTSWIAFASETGFQTGQGFQGRQGNQGEPGQQGNQGAVGNGAQGDTGAQGATGTQGATGAQGAQGAQGTAGTQGLNGTQGATGAQGAQGTTGAQGNQGVQGSAGAQGAQGAQGTAGTAGSQGAQGGYANPVNLATGVQGVLAVTNGGTGSTVGNITETVYTISDGASVNLNPANGGIQLWTLGANRTPTATSFVAGQSMTLMVDDGSGYTIDWTSIGVSWLGGITPTLASSGYTTIELWKTGTTVYGAAVGGVGTINNSDTVYTITDGASVDLNPANGGIQLWTLGASRTPTATSWTSGQAITLMVDDGTAYSITWSSVGVTWVGGSAPTLSTTGYTIIVLWKTTSIIYGALVGNA